jgi:hypothetical protein
MKRINWSILFLALFTLLGCSGNLPQVPEKIVCFDFIRGPLTADQLKKTWEEIEANDPVNKKNNWIKFNQPQYVIVGKHLCHDGQFVCGKPYLAEEYVINRGKELFVIIANEQGKEKPVLLSNLEKESQARIKKEISLR